MIHKESCKKQKFGYTHKWFTHEPESVLENENHISLQYIYILAIPAQSKICNNILNIFRRDVKRHFMCAFRI